MPPIVASDASSSSGNCGHGALSLRYCPFLLVLHSSVGNRDAEYVAGRVGRVAAGVHATFEDIGVAAAVEPKSEIDVGIRRVVAPWLRPAIQRVLSSPTANSTYPSPLSCSCEIAPASWQPSQPAVFWRAVPVTVASQDCPCNRRLRTRYRRKQLAQRERKTEG